MFNTDPCLLARTSKTVYDLEKMSIFLVDDKQWHLAAPLDNVMPEIWEHFKEVNAKEIALVYFGPKHSHSAKETLRGEEYPLILLVGVEHKRDFTEDKALKVATEYKFFLKKTSPSIEVEIWATDEGKVIPYPASVW